MNPSDSESGSDAQPRMAVMCCMCKKIRHDDGEWRPADPGVRKYIGDVFSHGYCPDCREIMQVKVDELDTVPPNR